MIFEFLTELILRGMDFGGYSALFLLMALESMIAPIPSEIVMPFAGFLIVQGKFTLLSVALISAIGSVFGSLLSYWIGIFGGRRFILRFGKYLLLDESHLEWTEGFFKKHGEKTIFISRFIPVVRHLISIPAGIGKMRIGRFMAYTFAGALIWNTFLAWVGMKLRERWEIVHNYSSQIDVIMVAILAVVFIWFVYKHVKKRQI
ncbi:MAG: DedA family protein [Candidatus Nanoarchaeia archaeon]|jgi:membrane protein DedA with SNARE-associated domain